MKNTLLVLLLVAAVAGAAQKPYWQQRVDVTIQVQLNDTEHTLDGFEKILYTNHSPDTLRYIWFHLWPNAYKNDRTAFSEQLLKLGNTDFYFASKEQRGYINRLDFKVNNIPAKTEDHPESIDVVKLLLPAPLPPDAQAIITTPFHVKLPYLFSRSGYKNGSFQVTQWYPKPAVYDARGWHPMPYLEQGEFYSEFGDYDVTITLPQTYVVAATGVLQNNGENTTQRSHKSKATEQQNISRQYGHLKKLGNHLKNKMDSNFFKTLYALKTLRYKQQNIHDFAWVANKNFRIDFDTCQLVSGKIITVFTYYINKPKTVWKKSLAFAKDAVRFYSTEVGDYPYSTLRIVESEGAPGGMEYPTLSIIGPADSEKDLDGVIAHEAGHNWFYAALATNERESPWLDEGLNTFYDNKYMARKYGPDAPWPALLFQTLAREKRDQPIALPAPLFSAINYSLVVYDKTARWLDLLQQQLGPQRFQQTMHTYFLQWQFKHPQEEDLKEILATALPDTTNFKFLYSTGLLPNQPLTRTKVLTPLLPGTIKSYMQHPSKHIWFLSPAAGYNYYDKAMIGGLITNFGLPPSRVQFLAVPLYGTGSKKWNGIGTIRYSQYSAGWLRKWEAGLSGMSFSKNYMPDSNGHAHFERFYKLAPALRFTLNEPIQSTRERWLEAKTFFITEKNFSKFVTKTSDGLIYVDSLSAASRYVNQLTWNETDYRALYPYSYRLQMQQGPAFYRFNATGTYFFNYPKGGGAEARLFFSAFGYLTRTESQRLDAARYEPKLLGNTGEEDFSYSSYFMGRSASYANDASVVQNDGLAAQQIMLRDGGFKLRLDEFDFLQGRSEHWVAALNLNTTLPHQIMPTFIPLKLFLDVGTYAEALKQQLNMSRILYVGGLQLLLAHNVINIYAPLVYSAVFRDNLKTLPEQNTFLKRLTFSIDFGQLSVKHFTGNKFSF